LGPLERQPIPFNGLDTWDDEYFSLLKEIEDVNLRNSDALEEFKEIQKDLAYLKSTFVKTEHKDELEEKWKDRAVYKLAKKASKLDYNELRDSLDLGEITEVEFLKKKKKIGTKEDLLVKSLEIETDIIMEKLKSEKGHDDLIWTKNGTLGLKSNNLLRRKGMVKSKNKTKSKDWVRTQSDAGVNDYFKEVEEYYNIKNSLRDYDECKLENFSTEGAYQFNESLEKLNKTLDNKADALIKEVTDNLMFAK
jgi:ribonuclease HI